MSTLYKGGGIYHDSYKAVYKQNQMHNLFKCSNHLVKASNLPRKSSVQLHHINMFVNLNYSGMQRG
jgi:signal peptidase I